MPSGQMRIEDQRFSPEDLFALLGGFDAEMFACPGTLTGNTDRKRTKKLEKWRRDVVRRYAGLGLVDDAGTPRADLARALEPLAQPRLTIANDKEPALWNGEREKRIACIYLREDGTGTAVVRGAGRHGGFFLLPLASETDVIEATLAIHRLNGSFVAAPPAQHVVIGGDPDLSWARALMHDQPSEVIACAERAGFDPTRVLAFGVWWHDEGSRLQAKRAGMSMLSTFAHTDSAIGGAMFDRMAGLNKQVPIMCVYVVADYQGIEFSGTEADGIAYRLADFERDGSFRAKTSICFPSQGFSYAFERAPRPQDPKFWNKPEYLEFCRFGSFDFHSSAEAFVRRLMIIDDNPNAGGR